MGFLLFLESYSYHLRMYHLFIAGDDLISDAV